MEKEKEKDKTMFQFYLSSIKSGGPEKPAE